MEIELPVKDKVFPQPLSIKKTGVTSHGASGTKQSSSQGSSVQRSAKRQSNGRFTPDSQKLSDTAVKKSNDVSNDVFSPCESDDPVAVAVAPAPTPHGLDAKVIETMHRKTFSCKGNEWQKLLTDLPGDVEGVLLNEISLATTLPLKNIRIVSMNVDEKFNLVTEFSLFHDAKKSAVDVDDALNNHHFGLMKSLLKNNQPTSEVQDGKVNISTAGGMSNLEKSDAVFGSGNTGTSRPRSLTKKMSSTTTGRRERSVGSEKRGRRSAVDLFDVRERGATDKVGAVPKPNKRAAYGLAEENTRQSLTPRRRRSASLAVRMSRRTHVPALTGAQGRNPSFFAYPNGLTNNNNNTPRNNAAVRSPRLHRHPAVPQTPLASDSASTPRRHQQAAKSPVRFSLLLQSAIAKNITNSIGRGDSRPIPPQRVVRVNPLSSAPVGADDASPATPVAPVAERTVAAFFRKHVERKIITGSPVRTDGKGQANNEAVVSNEKAAKVREKTMIDDKNQRRNSPTRNRA